jgi:hypothetical protein
MVRKAFIISCHASWDAERTERKVKRKKEKRQPF